MANTKQNSIDIHFRYPVTALYIFYRFALHPSLLGKANKANESDNSVKTYNNSEIDVIYRKQQCPEVMNRTRILNVSRLKQNGAVTYLSVDANVLIGVDSHQNWARICLWNVKEIFCLFGSDNVMNKNWNYVNKR